MSVSSCAVDKGIRLVPTASTPLTLPASLYQPVFVLLVLRCILCCPVDKGIQTGPDSKYFALYSEMKKSYTNDGKELVLQVRAGTSWHLKDRGRSVQSMILIATHQACKSTLQHLLTQNRTSDRMWSFSYGAHAFDVAARQ